MEKEDYLVHKILGACEAINKMLENFERVRQNVVRRSNARNEIGGWLL